VSISGTKDFILNIHGFIWTIILEQDNASDPPKLLFESSVGYLFNLLEEHELIPLKDELMSDRHKFKHELMSFGLRYG